MICCSNTACQFILFSSASLVLDSTVTVTCTIVVGQLGHGWLNNKKKFLTHHGPNSDHVAHLLGGFDSNNIGQLRVLNSTLFPVNYSDKFYKEVLEVGEFAKLAYFNDVCAGAVCCRVEPIDTNESASKLYIMTLGVLKPYRHLGIGRKLLDHILEHASSNNEQTITEVYLHVQTTNQEALSFYKNQGFEITGTTNNYYKNIDDKDAYVLTKPIHQ